MNIEFLGVGASMPEYEQADTASLLVNRHILVDTGWFAVRNLLRTGVDPTEVTDLFLTHLHQDHILGLPAFLFYFMNGIHDFRKLTIYGPEGTEEAVMSALGYAGHERDFSDIARPEIVELPERGAVEIEEGKLRISFIPSHHAVPGRCFRFAEPETGKSFVYSGDTEPFAEFVPFAKDCDLLIHEASFGTNRRPADNPYRHSDCYDAAEIADAACTKKLCLVHARASARTAMLNEAKQIFAETFTPTEANHFTV